MTKVVRFPSQEPLSREAQWLKLEAGYRGALVLKGLTDSDQDYILGRLKPYFDLFSGDLVPPQEILIEGSGEEVAERFLSVLDGARAGIHRLAGEVFERVFELEVELWAHRAGWIIRDADPVA
jgi:hypothetical protein